MRTFPYNLYFVTEEEQNTRKLLALLHRKQDQQATLQTLRG